MTRAKWPPAIPAGLGSAGRGLWRQIIRDLEEGTELDARELRLLLEAARQADSLAALDRAVRKLGTMVVGSTGQPRLNPAVIEARHGRTTLARLLGDIRLVAEEDAPATAAGRRAQKAAQARWSKTAQVRELRKARRGA